MSSHGKLSYHGFFFFSREKAKKLKHFPHKGIECNQSTDIAEENMKFQIIYPEFSSKTKKCESEVCKTENICYNFVKITDIGGFYVG